MGGLTNFPGGLSSMGVPLMGRQFGKTYFVDSTNGSDGNKGLNNTKPFKTLTKAFATVTHYDTILLSGGNFTGNYTTPANADAAFVTVRGFRIGSYGLSTWMGATTASSPIIDVKARGWTFSDIEFDCPTAAGALNLNKSNDGTTDRPDFCTIHNNIFTTGKFGIVCDGGGTHVHIHHNKFDQLTTSGAFAIIVDNTDHQIPAFWVVEDNIFATSLNHIGPANASQGWSESMFRRNVHQSDGVATDATTILDIRAGSGGGNMIIDNYFDIAKDAYNGGTTVRANSSDFSAGNWFNNGAQEEAL